MRPKSFSHGKRFYAAGGWPAGLLILILTPGLLLGQAAPQLPPGDGRDLVAAACTQCHALRPILMKRDGVGGWRATVEEMVIRGAQLLPEEAETVVKYLAASFGPGPNPMQSGTLPPGSAVSSPGAPASSVSLPAGPGKEVVEARCALCHDLGRVVGSRRTREEWERLTRNMIERGPQAPPDQVQAIVSYLAAQFGKPAD